MTRKESRAERLFAYALAVALLCSWALFARAVITTATQEQPTYKPAPAAKDWRPDISKCPDDVELWDCIRHAKYRSEDQDG